MAVPAPLFECPTILELPGFNRGRGYKNICYLLLKAKRMPVTNTEYIAFQEIRKAA